MGLGAIFAEGYDGTSNKTHRYDDLMERLIRVPRGAKKSVKKQELASFGPRRVARENERAKKLSSLPVSGLWG